MSGRSAPVKQPTTETSTSLVGSVVGALGGSLGGALGGAHAAVRGAADVVGEMARGLATPSGLAGAAIETGWFAVHLATYPLGLAAERREPVDRGYRIEHLRPHQRGLLVSDVEAAGTPILMVHGLNDNRSIFTLMQRGLRARGFDHLTTLNYSSIVGDIRIAAARLGEEVERIVTETGYERVHIIGHSMGGLIARYYVTRLGGDEHVHTLVTLGTPHEGTYVAYAWPARMGVQMRPGSGLMKELRRPVPACRTRFIAYWSDLDQFIFPQHNAALNHPDLQARNIALHGVGHSSLPILGSVVHGISGALADLAPDGSTRRPGVSPITPRGRRRGGGLTPRPT